MDPQRAAVALVARLRRSELPRDRVELAAHVGDVAARVALGRRTSEEPPDDPLALIGSLWPWGKEALVLAAAEAARLCLRDWEALAARDRRPRRAVEAALAWVARPDDASALAAGEAAARAREAALATAPEGPAALAALAAHQAAACAAAWPAPIASKHAVRALLHATRARGPDLVARVRVAVARWALHVPGWT